MKGRTNNPNGRPKGTGKNQIAKKRLQEQAEGVGKFYDVSLFDGQKLDRMFLFTDGEMSEFTGADTKYTIDRANKILQVLRIDGTLEEAVNFAGISMSTFYEWRKKYEKFDQACESAKDFIKIAARKIIAKDIIENGNVGTAMNVLNRRDSRYREKREIVEEKKLTLNPEQASLIFGKLDELKQKGLLDKYKDTKIINYEDVKNKKEDEKSE